MKGGAGIMLCTIWGGQDTWPGTPVSFNDVPATDLMWSFFAAHPKPLALPRGP
jgi:poly(3-hydroxybutyrate) depolymerase